LEFLTGETAKSIKEIGRMESRMDQVLSVIKTEQRRKEPGLKASVLTSKASK
jgi:hypothetical protein